MIINNEKYIGNKFATSNTFCTTLNWPLKKKKKKNYNENSIITTNLKIICHVVKSILYNLFK